MKVKKRRRRLLKMNRPVILIYKILQMLKSHMNKAVTIKSKVKMNNTNQMLNSLNLLKTKKTTSLIKRRKKKNLLKISLTKKKANQNKKKT